MRELIKNKVSLFLSALGVWLLAAPTMFGDKGSKMCLNDIISGALLFFLGLLIYKTKKKVFCYAAALLGVWLQLAPLFFWAKDSGAYLNDTLVGIFVIVLAFLIPGMTAEEQEEGTENPAGWSFNPSAFAPRVITVFLAMICWFLARYLAAYQLGYIDHIFDPFFGNGTTLVITSSLAQGFPVSDAGLGAFAYSMEFVLGVIGGSRRWRSMPWLSVVFGLLVVPAGMVSILLIVSQPVIVGAWCGLCLMIASCMLVMIVMTAPEVFAALQLLYQTKKAGRPFWKTFWKGSASAALSLPAAPIARKGFSELGFTCPWNLILSACLGIWLMCAPTILGIMHPAADSNYIAGPLIVAFSIISMSEVIRGLRFVNLFFGLLLISAPFWMEGFSSAGIASNLIIGVCIALLSFRKGMIRERYGKW